MSGWHKKKLLANNLQRSMLRFLLSTDASHRIRVFHDLPITRFEKGDNRRIYEAMIVVQANGVWELEAVTKKLLPVGLQNIVSNLYGRLISSESRILIWSRQLSTSISSVFRRRSAASKHGTLAIFFCQIRS